MHLDLIRDSSRVMPEVAAPKRLRSVRVWHCRYESLASLARLTQLRVLVIASFPDQMLDALAKLKHLKYLRILHLPHVSDLSPLAALRALESLALETLPSWDSSGKVTVVKSLEPIACLPKLHHLQLFGVRPRDESLRSLERCTSLKTARFSKYPKEEIDRFYAATGITNRPNPDPLVQARIEEGLQALSRGDVVDGEKFFARWRSRFEDAARPDKRARTKRKA